LIHDPIFHLLAWPKSDDRALCNLNRLACSGITCLSGFPSFDLEYPEVAKFDSAFSDQGINDAIEKHLDGIMNQATRKSKLIGQENDHVFFRHPGVPLLKSIQAQLVDGE
jgi:hypothetical protein